MKSIIQKEKKCYKTGRTDSLECHHLFGGANRKNSEKYGLKVWLTSERHNQPPGGVHHDKEFMRELHEAGQKAFERVHGTRADFMRIFGRNYIEG